MSEPEKKKESRTKKSRPKSAVVTKSAVRSSRKHGEIGENGEKTKTSHSRKDGSSRIKSDTDHSNHNALHTEIEELKKALESAKTEILQSSRKVSELQKENGELIQKVQNKKNDSSSSNDGGDEQLKAQLQAEHSKLQELSARLEEQESTIANLKRENTHFKAANEQRERDLQAESHRLQEQIRDLTEKQEALEKENQDLKTSTRKPVATTVLSTQTNSFPAKTNSFSVTPRNQVNASGNVPTWKLREMERQKQQEEEREKESRTKLQKVQSLKLSNNIITEGNKNFKDPVLNKPTFHHGGVIDGDDKPESSRALANEVDNSPVVASDMTEQEKIEVEM